MIRAPHAARAGSATVTGSPLLRIDGLSVAFDTPGGVARAVRGLTLDVPRGETVGLVGESGSGKTVTALSVMRLLRRPGRVTGGRIVFDGRDLLALSEAEMEVVRGRDIAMIAQQPRESLNPVLTVGAQMRMVLQRHAALRGVDVDRRARELLGHVELSDAGRVLRAYPHELSGGMCQRVMIALCLACAPRLLIADEATTALDVTVQLQILRLLRRLQEEMGLTLVVITHNLGVVAELCHRVAIMYAGELVEYAPVADVFRAARHPYTRRLLACRPHVSTSAVAVPDDLPAIPGAVPDPAALPGGCAFHPRCHRAEERCGREHPALREAASGHQLRCFFPEESPA